MIVSVPDPVLRQVCEPVAKVKSVRDVVTRLRLAMQQSGQRGRGAAGLAAPQIGEPVRVFVLADNLHATPFINPVIVWRSTETDIQEEGCLSLPANLLVPVERHRSVTVEYIDLKGRARTITLIGLAARAAQHEMDHLDGILITDRRAQKPDTLYAENYESTR